MARIKFEECLDSAAGKDNQIDSFCLEKLADLELGQHLKGNPNGQ
jgi:hypothetical protein